MPSAAPSHRSLSFLGQISIRVAIESTAVDVLSPDPSGEDNLECLLALAQDESRRLLCHTQQEATDAEYRVRITGVVVAASDDIRQQREWGTLRVLRTFNSMPLLPEDAPVCAIDRVTREFLETKGPRFGLITKKRQRKSSSAAKDAIAAPVESAVPSLHATAAYDRLLQAAHSHRVWLAKRASWSEIFLVVSVQSDTSCFGTLCKTYLRESPSLTANVIRALTAVFEDLKAQAPAAFMSAAEIEMKDAREIYIPQLAQSIAHIIYRSDNEEFKNASFMILSMRREARCSVAPRAGSRVTASEPSEDTTPSAKRKKTSSTLDNLTEKLQALIL
ncbi:hypothetical protein BESB_001390 [Besnoitia besnoiti]|uniref:Uncharacterized protein n=1 Tax=Besnoitia besnoiti TaxID=94643 RepID=A0A2A9MP69_BESBE|nr:hypothetical protein BESB_001390 [Besnoitia besnoiti]PFH37797.1 hypothetical protein BESB_001390 [Besnoitia besnoiti]